MLLALLMRRPVARGALALTASSLAVVQIEYFRFYRTFVDDQAAVCAQLMWSDIEPIVIALLPWVVLAAIFGAVSEYWLLRSVPKSSTAIVLTVAGTLVGSLVLLPSVTLAPPDLRALWALRVLLRTHDVHSHISASIPPLQSRLTQFPNVLLIVDESVRASDYVMRGARATASETAQAIPDRVELRQLRSVSSYTAISVNALLSGHVPVGSVQHIASTPLVFDYLHALGQHRPRVLYWSTQSPSFFARTNLRNVVDSFEIDSDVAGRPIANMGETIELGMDRMLAAKIERELPAIELPVLLVAHLSGTHAPYFVDDAHAPYRPYTHVARWTRLNELHNAYLNAIVEQDRSVARIVRAFIAKAASEPYLVVFTSDHGEAFGERKAIHHGQNLYDEQIHVPGWIAFGNGALSAQQAAALRAHANDDVTQLDVLPTLLDAYGMLDAFGMTRFIGRSLLQPFDAPPPPIPLTNCTELFPCPLNTWGMLAGNRSLISQAWDGDWRCIDLTFNREVNDLQCSVLRMASQRHWPIMPNGRVNR
jgi:glucan phosphoethanolaminetransferase (alkaline phosphatase superfamily)